MDKKGKSGKILAKELKGRRKGQKDWFQTLTVVIRAAPEAGPGEEKDATPA
jgi:hypothetical protein